MHGKRLTLGETATFESGLEGTVRNFRFESAYETGGTKQSTDRSFLFVDFTVTNPTSSPKRIPSGISIYATVDGKRYDPVDSKDAVRSLYTVRSLEGGATRSGALIFKVPKNTARSDVVATLEYSRSDRAVGIRWASK
ncbi:DUF4352 domain-containing protein [Haladaptatus sp. DYF46]|uniref:DUF4352 domain-containing protein n=1 Tax=Haladaptatus sp. DYF46 TaxID=2886041 RepID=UPI001E65C4D7|nr:DUF4352 domain-containing protein [Haladaptatus sp. DYF46]